ncbi:hypothetical protein [Streptomyces sp. NPDC004284]|uniref:hypothetical protein n=1 Tax=Streptomyces sp. NPDC004284 TaxID=3364695 RepID=UPI0036814ED2
MKSVMRLPARLATPAAADEKSGTSRVRLFQEVGDRPEEQVVRQAVAAGKVDGAPLFVGAYGYGMVPPSGPGAVNSPWQRARRAHPPHPPSAARHGPAR